MSLVGELTRVIHAKKYSDVVFLADDIPIVAVNFSEDRNVKIIVNNMEELRCYELKVNDNIDNFVSDVEDILIYSGVDTIVRKMKDSVIEFYAEPYLKGKIRENKIIISQEEVMFNEDQDDVRFLNRNEITAVITMTALTLAQVIGAFALQYYA
jgi:hypothetical protein